MITLVFTACLLSAPDDCRHYEMIAEPGQPIMACWFGAQAELASWLQEHPDRRITRWGCKV